MFSPSFVLLCALSLWSAGPPQLRPSNALTVQLNMEFDRSITSNVIIAGAKAETTAIWERYGVELLWSDSEVEAALHLDVVVMRNHTDLVVDRSQMVLGRTTIDPSGVVKGPIRISFDTLDSLLRERHGGDPVLHDGELGRALGRVLAHELGHVLLGAPRYHDAEGLMRATFVTDDLARLDRQRFRLTDGSAGRLRARIAHLCDEQRPQSVTRLEAVCSGP